MKNLFDLWNETFKHRNVILTIARSDYYKLKMICEAVNENVPSDYELTPDLICTRVLETFIQESFEDSTDKIMKQIMPNARRRKRS